MQAGYDIIAMGRSSIDLYSQDIGAAFEQISGFAAYVGGCPLNISVGARRLGLNSALLTAVGADKVGDFVLRFLNDEGVATKYIPRKVGHRTSAVLLGIEPPDRFPLTFYRDNCADIELNIDDVTAAPLAASRMLLITGTGLSKEPSRTATLYAAEQAKVAGATVVLDIDFRPDQWPDPRSFGVILRSALRLVDIVIGTADEINAAMLTSATQISLSHSQVSDARVGGDVAAAIDAFLALGPKLLVQKLGANGASIHASAAVAAAVPGFKVEVVNILGAGDAFASGFIYGYVRGWELYKAVRLGNACGAIVVTKPGCANFMPTYLEVEAFVANQGGW